MKNDDAQLIQRVLEGDDTAFSALVKKYRKPVHSLAWRKIGDFHIAEEITQDTFLKVYQRLSTLKVPQSFAGWLYVITTNQCKAWLRKRRTWTQSLENTSSTELENRAYSGYIIEENERTAKETQREVVKKILAKLQESERTVITLYYLGEMTYEEISEFLGVSEAAVRNRLYRARRRLKKEEPMIREALGNFQITPNLTENIMREISRLKPVAPPGSKPLVPWAIGVSTLAVILLMLGVGRQYLSHFQKPYSFDATSEMTVELTEAPVVLNLESKPDIRTQLGDAAAPNKNGGPGQQPDDVLFAAAQVEGANVSVPKQQWIRGNATGDTSTETLLTTPEGEIYVIDTMRAIYKSSRETAGWQYVNNVRSLSDTWWDGRTLLAKWDDTLYMVVSNKFLASTDDGKTWIAVSNRPSGEAVGLVAMDGVLYLAQTYTVYRSTDAGKTWMPMGDAMEAEIRTLRVIQDTLFATTTTGVYRLDNAKTWMAVSDGLAGEIRTLRVVQDTLFATAGPATSIGLYRFDVDSWKRLRFPVPEAERIDALAGTEDTLYVMVILGWGKVDGNVLVQMGRGQKRSWWIFRSIDKGESWTDITPTNAWPIKGHYASVELAAVGKTVLVIGRSDGAVVRSIDDGDTWTRQKNTGISGTHYTVAGIEALNENTFYTRGNSGIHRSIDGGKSWERFNPGTRSYVKDLIASRANSGANTPTQLYAATLREVVKSTDNGKTWRAVNPQTQITEFRREGPPEILAIVKSNGVIYAKGKAPSEEVRLYEVSQDSNTLMRIREIPVLHSRALLNQLLPGNRGLFFHLQGKSFVEQLKEGTSGATQFFKQLAERDPRVTQELLHNGLRGALAVAGNTFYMEYNFKLFRWMPGETEWYDTGVEETHELSMEKASRALAGMPREKIVGIVRTWEQGFRLAVSGNTVYVGKRDGHLVASFDKGNNWLNLTPALPFPVKAFYDMVFVGATVYVATDAGVAASSDGKRWHAITDAAGTPIIIERLAVDGTSFYGVSKTGVYRLEHENDTWKQIASEVPESVSSLAVDGNVLYVGTWNNGVLHFHLDE
ncbi:MAG: sigma-70 family RNA polymerase sigma factor [Candidatus Poribacteria bacterium]|nr:sigma-70 family RNA polymerase sigma factor [Candidatus Poribacteria bacterium]